jgi:phosphoglycolate phosphatase
MSTQAPAPAGACVCGPPSASCRRVNTLFFDLDGTLIDSAVGIARCVAHALDGLGHPGLPAAELRRWIGPALRTSFGTLFEDPGDVERAVALYRERYDAVGWTEHTVYDGIGTAVTTLHAAGHRLAVVTAKNEPHARRIVSTLPFGHCFDDVIGATPDGRLSHKPELIAEALHRLDLHPDGCTMIGDRHLDIEGARHHGMRGIGVLWGFGDEDELRAAGAHGLAHAPQALAALLAQARSA